MNIIFEFKFVPLMGGNQFLLALKNYSIKNNKYEPKRELENIFKKNTNLKYLYKLLWIDTKK